LPIPKYLPIHCPLLDCRFIIILPNKQELFSCLENYLEIVLDFSAVLSLEKSENDTLDVDGIDSIFTGNDCK
jgi:hypothetical protein